MAKSGKFEDSAGRELRKRLNALNKQYGQGDKPAVFSADSLKSKPRPRPQAANSLARDAVQGRRRVRQPEKPRKVEPVVYHRDIPRVKVEAPRTRIAAEVTLEDTVDGMPTNHSQWGTAYVVRTIVSEVPGADTLDSRFRYKIESHDPTIFDRIKFRTDLDDVAVEDFCFMDIETTGLGNSPVFLIGVMVWNGKGFEVQQYLARNYAEEAAILAFFIDECAQRKLLVTFNGKSFDFPYIRTRSAATGVRFNLAPAHLDLLHVGRKIWKGTLPNCKLQTLEHHICGRIRHGDIPGSEIPDAYHAYVRTNNAYQIVETLKHNMLDLVTLADIMTHLPPMPPEPVKRRRKKK